MPHRIPTVPARLACAALLVLAPSAAQLSGRVVKPPRPPEFVPVAVFAQGSIPLTVGRVLLNGQLPLTLVSGTNVWQYGTAVDRTACHVYAPLGPPYASWIARVDLDGSNLTPILTNPGFGGGLFWPMGVALDRAAGRIYWISPGLADRIGSCALDGSGPLPSVYFTDMTPQVSPRSIHVDSANGRIYWWDQASLGFRRADVDAFGNTTNPVEVCFTGAARSFDVDVLNQVLYWTVGGAGATFELRRAPIPASPPVDLSTSGYTVLAVETDGTRSFFTNLLDASPETGVVAWISFNGELSWKPIDGDLSVPNNRSASFPYLPTGGLQIVEGPYLCF